MKVELSKKELIEKELNPNRVKIEKKNQSKFKFKDEFFDKEKTYIDRKTRQVKTLAVDFRTLNIGGLKIVAFKGEFLSKEQAETFNKEAKDYWLKESKGKKVVEEVKTESDSTEPTV